MFNSKNISPMAAITRNGINNGWTVRLWYSSTGKGGAKPMVNTSFLDRNYDNKSQNALEAAKVYRDECITEAIKSGKPGVGRKYGPHLRVGTGKPNRTGVVGVTWATSPPLLDGSITYSWKTYWSEKVEGGHPRSKRFGFKRYGGIEAAFRAACQWRYDMDMKLWGASYVILANLDTCLSTACDNIPELSKALLNEHIQNQVIGD